MEPTKTDETEVLETPVENAEETVETPELTAEHIAELKAKAAKADDLEEKNKQLYERAKKAEAKKTDVPSQELSTKDVIFLAKANVHEDDLDEVLDWAKFKKISVSKAHEQLKGVLASKDEQRKTAAAANISPARRSATKVTDDVILERASRGELPENEDDIARLIKAKSKKR